jgi:hypothetical protein
VEGALKKVASCQWSVASKSQGMQILRVLCVSAERNSFQLSAISYQLSAFSLKKYWQFGTGF